MRAYLHAAATRTVSRARTTMAAAEALALGARPGETVPEVKGDPGLAGRIKVTGDAHARPCNCGHLQSNVRLLTANCR